MRRARPPRKTNVLDDARLVDAGDGRLDLVTDAGDVLGHVEWRSAGDAVILAHTEVPQASEGQGIGGRIVRHAFDWFAERDQLVIPPCPFAKSWVARHPEYLDRVDSAFR